MASAPVRIADAGGWTDTWFAAHGVVCNIAAGPGVEVVVDCAPDGRSGTTTLFLPDFDETVVLDRAGRADLADRHPVLAQIMSSHLPQRVGVETVTIRSAVPPGSSLGTSAAVGVALIAALREADGVSMDRHELAVLAHRAETEAGLESGVQDHAAAAFGGVSLVQVRFPEFGVERVELSPGTHDWLVRCLRTVFLGRHDSSSTHRMVINRMQQLPDPSAAPELITLRAAAADAATALRTDDRRAYGHALMQTVHGQRELHPRLISHAAERLVECAVAAGGSAKVNGAGGDGGSVTLLGPDDADAMVAFDAELEDLVSRTPGAMQVLLQPCAPGVTVARCGP